MLLVFSAFRAKDYGIPMYKTVGSVEKKTKTLLVFESNDEKFERETLSSRGVKDKIQSMGIEVVFISKDNSELVKKYSITTKPSVVLLSDNLPPRKKDGFMGTKEFLSWLK